VRARFEREAKTVSSLNHPHICTLFDVGRESETDCLVMELVEGETLATRLTMSRCRRNIGLAIVWGADTDDAAAARTEALFPRCRRSGTATPAEAQAVPGRDSGRCLVRGSGARRLWAATVQT